MDIFGNTDIPFLSLIKPLFLLALLVYVVFGFIVIKQVRLMSNTLEIGLEKGIEVTAYVHMFLVIFVFVLSLLLF